jgi:hypothetical protein
VFNGIRPKGSIDRFWLAMGGMKKGSSAARHDIFDPVFSFSILMMCIDTAKQQSLPSLGDGGLEGLRIEKTIIGMVVVDCNTM